LKKSKLIIPITAKTPASALKDISKANKLADLIELRLDCLNNPSSGNIKALVKKSKKPVIATCRFKGEGGEFRGTEIEKSALLEDAIQAGAKYVDLELSMHADLRDYLAGLGARVILSHHDFEDTPLLSHLSNLFDRMQQQRPKAFAFKIVTFARDFEDNARTLMLSQMAAAKKLNLISFCMGDLGKASRILAPAYGGFAFFGSLSEKKNSAPGQITVEDLKKFGLVKK